MKADTFTDWLSLPKPRGLQVVYDVTRDMWISGIRGRLGFAQADLGADPGGNAQWRHSLARWIAEARRAERNISPG